MVTLQWASVEHGDSAVRGAPKRASHALPSPPSSLFPTFVSIRGSIIPPFVLFVLFVVSSSSMDGRAQARQPRTIFSSLLPIPHYGSRGNPAVRGAPKRASHALPSPPSSLFSTCPCSSTLILMV